MNKERFQKLAGIITEAEQATVAPKVKPSSVVTAIGKDLEDQRANFELINNQEKAQQLFNLIITKLDPKFLETQHFKRIIKSLYDKYYL